MCSCALVVFSLASDAVSRCVASCCVVDFRIIFRLFTACLGHQVDSGGSSFGTKGPTHPTFKRRVRTRVTKLQMMLARFPGPLAQFEELTCKPK